MKHSKRSIAVCMSALLALQSVPLVENSIRFSASAASTVSNPIIWADVPDDDIIRVGDTYYMVSTTMYFSPGAPIMKSKDLVSWEICNYVYDTYADGNKQNLKNGEHDYAHGQWAASLRYHKGSFYVLFGSYGTNKTYIYQTADIEHGQWTRTEINGMYHDASMLFDDNGNNYLVYGAGGTCKIKQFNAQMTGFIDGTEKTLFSTGLDNLAGEGWHIQKINGYYYVFAIAWPSNSGRIELCYRSKDLFGTYEGRTVLNSGLGTYGSGVAQGGIVDTPDGKWYGLLFQDHGAVGRIPVLVPVTWQDGFPMMGINGKAPLTLTIDGDYTGTQLAKDDSFSYSSNDLALEWQWNHNPDNTAWSVTERAGYLRLHNNSTATNILNARNTLTQRTEGPSCSSVIKLDTKGMKAGDYAGLSAFQFKYGNVGVRVADDGSKKIYMSENGGFSNSAKVSDSYDKIVEETNLNGNEIYLKIEYLFNTVDASGNCSNNIDKANFYYSYDGNAWTKIGSELSMVYSLTLFTGYRSGIYSYATKSVGGYADIDFFDHERAAWNEATVTEPDENGYYFHDTFEGSTNDWSGRGSANVLTSGRTAYEGKEALLTENREAAWNGACKSLSANAFVPGNAYSFSSNVIYFDGDDVQTFFMKLQYQGADGETYYSTVAQGTAEKGKWMQLANTDYTIPADASNMQLYVETAEATNNFYIDDAIGAVAGTEISGAGVSDVYTLGDVNGDGIVSIADVVLLQKWILSVPGTELASWKAGDLNRDGHLNALDITLMKRALLKPAAEEKLPYDYDPAVAYKEAPANYFTADGCKGKLINETYTGINGTKKLNVYLPPDYDANKKYNVFYLMHGGGENENVLVNSSDGFNVHYMIDHMIQNKEIEPMIVVFPTFNGCPDGASDVWDEMKQSIVPFVEGKYASYAENTTPAGLEASRMHRAYGGFSMGGGSTWNVLINDNDYFAYYMPLSGHCWGGATPVLDIMKNHKYKDSTYIFAATGTDDIAYQNMCGLINDLKKDPAIRFTSDFSKGNFYFLEASGKTHWWGFVKHYVYDALPCFFRQ